MIKITKVRRSGVIGSLFLLPLFLLCAGWAIYKGLWLEALVFLVGWLFIFLFSTSYLFQALIVFVASIYFSISQHVWWVGVVGVLLTVYLYYANKITDKDIATLPNHIILMSPSLKKFMELIDNPRKSFILLLVLVVLAVVVASIIRLFLN